MDNIVIDERYNFTRAVPSRGELQFSSGRSVEAQEVIAFVAVASADTLPLELISVRPNEIAAIPWSSKGVTKVRYVGDAPLACVERDDFGNIQVAVQKNSAIEVVYSVPNNRGGNQRKKKIFTTVT